MLDIIPAVRRGEESLASHDLMSFDFSLQHAFHYDTYIILFLVLTSFNLFEILNQSL